MKINNDQPEWKKHYDSNSEYDALKCEVLQINVDIFHTDYIYNCNCINTF